jgi:hypothetical protein
MPARKIEIKPIQFSKLDAGAKHAQSEQDTYSSVANDFAEFAAGVAAAYQTRFAGASTGRDPVTLVALVGEFLRLMQTLDAEYGGTGGLPVVDAALAVDEALTALAELDSWLSRLDLVEYRDSLLATQLAVGHWSMCHELRFCVVAPLVNALAEKANAAESRQENAAVFAMMQGLVEHLAPQFAADLERSNPERPWRLLNLNLAITGIRTGDPGMIGYAFEQLDRHLPDECRGFYEEAHAIAVQPGFPPECGALIEAGYRRWTQPH